MSVFNLEDRFGIHFEYGRERQWQTIVKTIRLVASKVEVNKLQAVKVVTRKPAADKPSRVVSKVASRAVRVDNKVVSKATANLFRRR